MNTIFQVYCDGEKIAGGSHTIRFNRGDILKISCCQYKIIEINICITDFIHVFEYYTEKAD